VILCLGDCQFGDAPTVLDVFSYTDGDTDAIDLPGNAVTFEPDPVTGIATADMEERSYLRIAFTGDYPHYAAEDWEESSATRSSCPSGNPDGDGCDAVLGALCHYGNNDVCECIWLGFAGQVWSCN
jgi:hypothetical protein